MFAYLLGKQESRVAAHVADGFSVAAVATPSAKAATEDSAAEDTSDDTGDESTTPSVAVTSVSVEVVNLWLFHCLFDFSD